MNGPVLPSDPAMGSREAELADSPDFPETGFPETGFPEKGPRRTCIACREEGDRADLLRLVAAPSGEVVVDLRARLPGRGAWVHPERKCVELVAVRGGMLSKALGVSVVSKELVATVRGAVQASALDALSVAAKAGALVGGFDVLEASLRRGEVIEVVLASDASERTVSSLQTVSAPRDGVVDQVPFTVIALDREALGARVGRGSRAALGVLRSKACTPLRTQLRRLRALS